MIDINKIKLIATDIDGTLIPYGGTMAKDADRFFEGLKKTGIRFCPASGKTHRDIVDCFKIYDIDYDFIMAINGSLITEKQKPIYSKSMTKKDCEIFFNFALEHDISLFFYSDFVTYFLKQTYKEGEWEQGLKDAGLYEEYMSNIVFVSSLDEVTTPINKFEMYLFDTTHTNEYIEELKKNEGMEIVTCHPSNIEATNKGVSKGEALRFLLDYLSITPDEVIVCGDSGNDTEMMKIGCHNICPSNATDEIKAYCEVITDSCQNHGIESYLMELFEKHDRY